MAISRVPASAFGSRRDRLAERVSEVVHGAASVSFELGLEDLRRINVEGTRRVLEFAERADARGGLRRFSYISTAYVAGEHAGCFSEDELDLGQCFRNAYEQSKFEAECLLTRARRRLGVTVLRPSIIVGERDSGWTQSFNVLYWPLRAFSRGAYVALPARRDAPVNVVSVDYVADAIFTLSQAPEAEGVTYHLTAGANATSVGELIELAAAYFRRPAPRLILLAYTAFWCTRCYCKPPAMSAAAERYRAARSSFRTSRWRSPTTIAAREWRFVGPASRPHRCLATSSGSSSLRSPPSGGGGRYHELVSCAPPRPSHTTASPSSGAPHASAARDRVAGAWRKARRLELARRGDDEQLPPIGARRVLSRRGDAYRAHARRLGRDA